MSRLFLAGCLLLALAGLAMGQDGDQQQQPLFELTKTQALQDDKEDHVIAVAEDTGFVYTGGRKLSQLNKDLVPLREYTPAVDTTFTALIADAEHVFAATANKEVLKLRRSDLSL